MMDTSKSETTSGQNLGLRQKISNWVVENWFIFNIIRTGYLFLVAPLIFQRISQSLEITDPIAKHCSDIIIATLIVAISLLFEWKKYAVIEKQPQSYLRVEKWNMRGYQLSLVLYIVIFVEIASLVIVGMLNTSERFSIVFSILDVIAYPSVYFLAGSVYFSVSKSLRDGILFPVKPLTSVSVRYRVILELTEKDNKAIKQKTKLFSQAIGIYNRFLRSRFDFVLINPEKYSKYLRLVYQSNDTSRISKMNGALTKLLDNIQEKDHRPLEVIENMKAIIDEPTSKFKDVVEEIEAEPSIKKTILAHLDTISAVGQLIFAIISVLIAVISGLLVR